MTLDSSIQDEKDIILLIALQGKMRFFNFVLEPSLGGGANVYSHDLSAGTIENVARNGVNFTPYVTIDGFITPTANRYYFDPIAKKIYLDFTSNLPVLEDQNFIEVRFFNYMSTKEIAHRKDPLNSSIGNVPWEPRILSFPNISKSMDQGFYGIMPSVTSSVTLSNQDSGLNHLIGAGTLASTQIAGITNRTINIYLMDETREVANTKVIFRGSVSSVSVNNAGNISVSFTEDTFQFDSTPDEYFAFDETFNASSFPNVDPAFLNTHIPTILGTVYNYEPTNINYKETGIGSTENRDFLVCKYRSPFTLSDFQFDFVVQNSPAPTSTRIYLDSVDNIYVGDQLFSQTENKSFRVSAIGSNFVDGVANASAFVGSETIRRDILGYVRIIDLDTGLASYADTHGVSPFASVSFNANLELRLTFSSNTALNPPSKKRVVVSLHGPNEKWHDALFFVINSLSDIPSSRINTTTFTDFDAEPSRHDSVGLILPGVKQTEKPTNRDVINQINAGRFSSVFQNSDSLIDVVDLRQTITPDYTFGKDDIIDSSIFYNETFIDLARSATVSYKHQSLLSSEPASLSSLIPYSSSSGSESINQEILYVADFYSSVQKRQINSLLFLDSEASAVASRGASLFGYPQQYLKIVVPLENYAINLGDIVRVSLAAIPGYNSLEDTNFVDYRVISTSMSESGISLKLWDQRGINNNGSLWP